MLPHLRPLVVAVACLASAATWPSAARAEDPPAGSATRPARPDPGPAVRERGSRRSRGGSAASGALFIAVLVAAIGHYVWKRLRR